MFLGVNFGSKNFVLRKLTNIMYNYNNDIYEYDIYDIYSYINAPFKKITLTDSGDEDRPDQRSESAWKSHYKAIALPQK